MCVQLKIEQIMTSDVISLSPADSIQSAIQIMRDSEIRHLPLTDDNNQLIGLVTERDIKMATPILLDKEKVKEITSMPLSSIMKKELITGHPLDFVEEAAVLFYDYKIGCLPIIQQNRLVGIITGTDLLHTMVELTGEHKPGSQIETKVANRSGKLHEITSVLKKLNTNILSVLIYPDQRDDDSQIIVLRVATMNPQRVIEQLKTDGLEVIWPQLPRMGI